MSARLFNSELTNQLFSLPLRSDRGRFSRLLFFSSLSLLLFVFFGCSDGMEREACVCDHGYERSDLCAEIIIIISGDGQIPNTHIK